MSIFTIFACFESKKANINIFERFVKLKMVSHTAPNPFILTQKYKTSLMKNNVSNNFKVFTLTKM